MRVPLITEIQRFSLQDGPGIRTTIFFKGCPLHCPWCHNPETQNLRQEFYFYSDKCTNCGRCVEVCGTGASSLVPGPDGVPVMTIDRSQCIGCMKCVDVCLSGAREIVGLSLSMDDMLREAIADRMFYKNSGGGVTISGGEPLFFHEFTFSLAERLKEEGVHVAIETSCFAEWEKIEPLLRVVDLFIVDIKTLDSEKHKRVIGWSLEAILKNIENLFQTGARVRIHLPIIPGFNDSPTDYDAYSSYLARFSDRIDGVDILPYHCYGIGKYNYLGRGEDYEYNGVEDLKGKDIIPLVESLKKAGIQTITVGGLVGMGKDRGALAGDGEVKEQAAG